jgi:rhamnulose-1-phosphate aldolase
MSKFLELISQIGEVGKRITELGMAEGAAGNLSVCVRGDVDFSDLFTNVEEMELPLPVPELAGASVIVTGSGRRLRDIEMAPTANLAVVVVETDGGTGKMYTAGDRVFKRITSEFNSHLAIHAEQVKARDVLVHTVLHAQPTYLTYLSHIPEYQEEIFFNQRLFRWQPETILSIPQGIGMLPSSRPAHSKARSSRCGPTRVEPFQISLSAVSARRRASASCADSPGLAGALVT